LTAIAESDKTNRIAPARISLCSRLSAGCRFVRNKTARNGIIRDFRIKAGRNEGQGLNIRKRIPVKKYKNEITAFFIISPNKK
jgi:hypothetical protein